MKTKITPFSEISIYVDTEIYFELRSMTDYSCEIENVVSKRNEKTHNMSSRITFDGAREKLVEYKNITLCVVQRRANESNSNFIIGLFIRLRGARFD